MDLGQSSILVTGAAGYIGSHCAKYLMEQGFNVVVIDNLSLGNMGAIKVLEGVAANLCATGAARGGVGFKFYKADISDTEAVGAVFKENKIDAVVHFAAFSQVGESVLDPLKYYINNTAKTALFLKEMLNAGVKKIVFSSTAAVYGEPEVMPILETAPLAPINAYGGSKLMIEKILLEESRAHDLKSAILRYFNVAGADKDGLLGEVHNPETHLVPNVLTPLTAGGGATFKLFGTDYPTPDGTCVRDYIHVEDLARAHYLALIKLFEGAPTGVYNLGASAGYSVREVYDTCCEITGKEIPLEITPRREGDPPTLIASNEKAAAELGFAPEQSLKDMVESAWNWVQNPKF